MAKKVDVNRYKQRAYRKKKDLAKFMKKLGQVQLPGMQPIIKKANAEAFEEIDCLGCANCCKTMTPTYSQADIRRISAHLGMTKKEFFDKWLEKRDDGDICNRFNPCQFLKKDNKCSIYEVRPADCSGFPHHVKKDFYHQVEQGIYIENLHRCPATLRFVEKIHEAVADQF